jgi:hypothetical protein
MQTAAAVSEQSIRLLRRVRGPWIQWAPARESYYVLAGILKQSKGMPPLDVTQDAIARLEAHLTGDPASLPFGLLAGQLCECPRTKLRYLLLDDVTRARSPLTDADPTMELSEELRWLAADASSRGKMVLGWYIGGLGDDLELDPDTSALHRELFPELWQVVLVHDVRAGVERGALLRADRVSDRLYAAPFFETYPEKAPRGPAGEPLTMLRWTTYLASEPVAPYSDTMIAKLATGSARAEPRSLWRRRWSELVGWDNETAHPAAPNSSTATTPRLSTSLTPERSETPARSETRARSETPKRSVTPERLPPPEARRAPTAPAHPAATSGEPASEEPRRAPASPQATTPAVEAQAPVQYIYMNGDLVPFDEAPTIGANEEVPSWLSGDRLLVALLAAVVLMVVVGAWLLLR